MTKELLLLVPLANVFALPIAYSGMNHWLQHFPYRGEIHVEIFLLVLPITLLVTFLSILLRSVKAAKVSPTESLKME